MTLKQLDHDLLKRLYRNMLRTRMVEEMIAERYAEQEMRCPTHLAIGQEAIAAGVSAALETHDNVLSGHRCHAHYLCKGGDLKAMVAELYGKETGCATGVGGSQHLIDLNVNFLGAAPILASTLSIATGTAFAAQLQKTGEISVVFFGDAATEEGQFYESLNFAALRGLPIVYVCENNFLSVNSPLEVRRPKGQELTAFASSFGMPSEQGDGNDVVAVYTLARQAVERARLGEGPTFLEFHTYRIHEHVGPYFDHELGQGREADWQSWRERCPVTGFEKKLLADGIVDDNDVEQLTSELRGEIESAFEFAKSSAFPDRDYSWEHAYAP